MAKVTALTERQRIELVLQDWLFWRGVFYPQFRLSQATRYGVLVDRAVFTSEPGKPGDVDILFCDPERPHEAVAVECKPLTITPDDFRHGDVRRLHNLDDAVEQANGLVGIGFERSYLLALIAVDASEQTHYNLANRGPTAGHLRTIGEAIQRLPLDERVGAVCLFATQLTARDITQMGGMGPWRLWDAEPQVQPSGPDGPGPRVHSAAIGAAAAPVFVLSVRLRVADAVSALVAQHLSEVRAHQADPQSGLPKKPQACPQRPGFRPPARP